MDSEIDNSEKVSMSEVRNCLKEAGSYDPAMTDSEMMEFYQVLNHSKHTASAEDQQRRILEETEKNCSMLEELRKNSVPVYREKDNKNYSKNDSNVSTSSNDQTEHELTTPQRKPSTITSKQIDVEEEISSTVMGTEHTQHGRDEESVEDRDKIDVFNSIPTAHKPLKRIFVKPLYNPPFYCNPKLLNMTNEQKARLITKYHLKLLHNYDISHRRSIIPATWGKPIQTNLRFNGSLMRKIEKPESDVDSQEFIQPLKDDGNSEDDFEVCITQSGRQSKRKIYCEDIDNNNEPKKHKTSSVDNNQSAKKLQTRKRVGQLKNEEIIKRSKLFTEPDTRTRTEKILDKVVEDKHKKKTAEKEIERFTETLKQVSDEENADDSSRDIADIVHSEEPFIRRRIGPPLHSRNITNQTASSSKSSIPWRGKIARKSSKENSSKRTDTEKYNPLETSICSNKATSKEETGTCPVCNVQFPQSKLTQHASGCGDSYSDRRSYSFSRRKIACDNCDQVLPLNMDYDEHVRDCLPKARRGTSKHV